MDKVRIDKWLWAARFFKTRSLAKQAIEGGKIQVDGQRVKPSRDITIDQLVSIRQGWDEKTVTITALTDQRRGASEASLLYQETADSLAEREKRALERSALHGSVNYNDQRPTKKQRRQIHRFHQQDTED